MIRENVAQRGAALATLGLGSSLVEQAESVVAQIVVKAAGSLRQQYFPRQRELVEDVEDDVEGQVQ